MDSNGLTDILRRKHCEDRDLTFDPAYRNATLLQKRKNWPIWTDGRRDIERALLFYDQKRYIICSTTITDEKISNFLGGWMVTETCNSVKLEKQLFHSYEFVHYKFNCPNREKAFYRIEKDTLLQSPLISLVLIGVTSDGQIKYSKLVDSNDYDPNEVLWQTSYTKVNSKPRFSDSKFNWESFDTESIWIVYESWALTDDVAIEIEFKCHQPIERKSESINQTKCSNWNFVNSFGLWSDANTDDDLYDFFMENYRWYDDVYVDDDAFGSNYLDFYPKQGWENYQYIHHSSNHVKQKKNRGFILHGNNYIQYEPLGINWNDSFCRRLNSSELSYCYVENNITTDSFYCNSPGECHYFEMVQCNSNQTHQLDDKCEIVEIEIQQVEYSPIRLNVDEEVLKNFNELSETELQQAFGMDMPVQSLNPYMTKLSTCSMTSNQMRSQKSSILFYDDAILRIESKNASELQANVKIDLHLESRFGVGLVRNDNYLGFYLNLTAWKEFINEKNITTTVFPVTYGQLDGTKSATHLIIVDDNECEAMHYLSDSKILNYYRQFLLTSSALFQNCEEEFIRRNLMQAVSRVFSGVSAILNFEITYFRNRS